MQQSCTLQNYIAALAIDGKDSGNFDSGTVSSTCCHEGPQWWQFVLPHRSEYVISEIVIRNRDGKLGWRLDDFVIEIFDIDGTVTWSHHQTFPNGDLRVFKVGSVVGHAVRIRALQQICLQLAEVTVNGYPHVDVPVPQATNLALQRPSWHMCKEGTMPAFDASLANDGNRDGDLVHGRSVSHTCYDWEPWWRVDLEEYKTVLRVDIYNRVDCCGQRLHHFEVQILDENTNLVDTRVYNSQVEDMISIHFDYARGRFVQIQLMGRKDVLNLAEVEVYGFEAEGEPHDTCHGN